MIAIDVCIYMLPKKHIDTKIQSNCCRFELYVSGRAWISYVLEKESVPKECK